MTTPNPGPGNQQARTLAPCETSFWAFLEYRSVVLAVLAFTLYMTGILIALMAGWRP